MLVLALVAGCFVTVFTPTASAASSLLELEKRVPSNPTMTFNADVESGNGLNRPYTIWWFYYPGEPPTGEIWLLVESDNTGKKATEATFDGKPGIIQDTFEQKGNLPTYSLIQFKDVWLDGNARLYVRMGNSNGGATGQTIDGQLKTFFTMITITYYDGIPFYKLNDDPIGTESVPLDKTTTITILDILSERLRRISHPGYTFYGWTTQVGGTVDYAAGDEISATDLAKTELDLYAVWIPKSGIVVTFDANTADTVTGPTPSTRSVTFDRAYGALAAISRTGYEFAGWFTEATCVTEVTVTTIVKNADAHTLYAKWTPRTDLEYVVNYLEQGTNKVLAPQKVVGDQTFGTSVTETAIDITGYGKIDPISVSINIDVEGNVINFYYVRLGVNEDGDNNIWDPNGGNGNGYGGGNNPQGTGGNGGTSAGTSTKTSNSKGNGNSQ